VNRIAVSIRFYEVKQEMSTKERFGTIVWNAMHELSYKCDDHVYAFVGISQVCESGGVSRPTAKKYLEQLRSDGFVSRMKINNSYCYRLLERSDD